MSMATFYAKINGVDHGPNGLSTITSISCTQGTQYRIGTAAIDVTFKASGGYTFITGQQVQIYEITGGVANVLFGGFVNHVTSKVYKGSTQKYMTISCADYNRLLDAIVRDAQDSFLYTVAAATLPTQITDLVNTMQQNGHGVVATPIDSTVFISNLTGAHTLPTFTIKGQSLRQALQVLMNNAQADTPALRPRFCIKLDSDGAGGVLVALAVWDGAAPLSARATFSDTPSGGQKAIKEYDRTLDGSMPLTNRRQSHNYQQGNSNEWYTYTGATSAATYPNPFINHGLTGNKGYWMDIPVKDTQSSTVLQAQTYIDRIGTAKEFPRETIKIVEDGTFISPGNGVTIIWSADGISALYEVQTVNVAFPGLNDASLTGQRFTLTCGLPLLELYESGGQGLAGPPSERDIVPPNAPTNFALTSNTFDPVSGQATLVFSYTASTSLDTAGYLIHLGPNYSYQIIEDVGNTLTPSVIFPPGVAYSVTAKAYDGATPRNISVPSSTTLTGTTASRPAIPVAPSITTVTSGQGEAGWYAQITVAHPSGDHTNGGAVTYHLGGGPTYQVDIPPGSTFPFVAATYGMVYGGAYTFNAYVIDAYQQQSALSSNYAYTIGKLPRRQPPPGGFEATHPDDALNGWSPIAPAVAGDFGFDASVTPFEGNASLKAKAAAGVNTKDILSPQYSCIPGETRVFGSAVKRGSGTGTAPVCSHLVRFFANDGTTVIGSDLVVWSAVTPTTSWSALTEAKIVVPAGAYIFSHILDAVGQTGASAYSIWFSWPRADTQQNNNRIADGAVDTRALGANAVTTAKIANGAVGDTQLGTLTNATKPQYDIETNPLKFYDAAARYRGQVVYDSAADITRVISTNPTTNTGFQIGTGNNKLDFVEPAIAAAYMRMSTGSVVLGTTSLATSATGGFLYIRAGAGPPTGVPVAQTGTYPIYYDSTNQKLYLYDGSWRIIGQESSDAQHGNRGGGALHPAAIESTAGFISAVDKTTLDLTYMLARITQGKSLGAWPASVLTGADASAVSTLSDYWGNKDLTFVTNKPTLKLALQNSLNILRFTAASSQYLANTGYTKLNGLAACTIFFVAKMNSVNSNAGLLWKGGGEMRMQQYANNFYAGTGGGYGHVAFTDTTNMHVWAMVYDGTLTGDANRLKLRKDGASQTLTFDVGIGTTIGSTNGLWLGADNGASVFADMDHGITLIVDKALAGDDLLIVEAMLKATWGTP